MARGAKFRVQVRHATRPARHAFAHLLLRAGVGAARTLPLGLSLRLGEVVARLLGPLFRADARTMRRQLALLSKPPPAGACWADLGRRVVELACAGQLLDSVVVHGEALGEVERPRGLIVATAHLGNWELMAAALAARGHPVRAIAARRQSGPIFRWLADQRRALGVHTLPPGGGARAATRILREGGTVALFVDLATRERSREVTLLGQPTPMPRTLERLRALTGADVVFAWTHREPDGRHHVHLEEMPEPTLQGLADRVDVIVRAHPAQWVWLHDRWPARDVGVS